MGIRRADDAGAAAHSSSSSALGYELGIFILSRSNFVSSFPRRQSDGEGVRRMSGIKVNAQKNKNSHRTRRGHASYHATVAPRS